MNFVSNLLRTVFEQLLGIAVRAVVGQKLWVWFLGPALHWCPTTPQFAFGFLLLRLGTFTLPSVAQLTAEFRMKEEEPKKYGITDFVRTAMQQVLIPLVFLAVGAILHQAWK